MYLGGRITGGHQASVYLASMSASSAAAGTQMTAIGSQAQRLSSVAAAVPASRAAVDRRPSSAAMIGTVSWTAGSLETPVLEGLRFQDRIPICWDFSTLRRREYRAQQ